MYCLIVNKNQVCRGSAASGLDPVEHFCGQKDFCQCSATFYPSLLLQPSLTLSNAFPLLETAFWRHFTLGVVKRGKENAFCRQKALHHRIPPLDAHWIQATASYKSPVQLLYFLQNGGLWDWYLMNAPHFFAFCVKKKCN